MATPHQSFVRKPNNHTYDGKLYFGPVIRVGVEDLREQRLEGIWNSPRFVELGRSSLSNGSFPCAAAAAGSASTTPIERRSVALDWPGPNPESGIMFEATL